jgi:hypothetical protein
LNPVNGSPLLTWPPGTSTAHGCFGRCEKTTGIVPFARAEEMPAVRWAFEGPDHRVVAANRAARASIGARLLGFTCGG